MSSYVTIDQAKLDAALGDAPDWCMLENTLYDLCRRHPSHAERAASNAKLWLIGRGFATGIERQIKSRGGQGSSMNILCEHVHRNHSTVDAVVGLLSGIAEPLNEDKLHDIAIAHGQFCRLLRPVLRKGVSPRSFAAKYLHFHCPAVPIYDSYAVWKLTQYCRWRREFSRYSKPVQADYDYHRFLVRFLQLYEAATDTRPQVTVRLLDLYLLWPE
jgi:hypothetical protein